VRLPAKRDAAGIDWSDREPCKPARREREVHARAIPSGAHDECSRAPKRRRTRIVSIGIADPGDRASIVRRAVERCHDVVLAGRQVEETEFAEIVGRRRRSRSSRSVQRGVAANRQSAHRLHLGAEHAVAVPVLNAALDGARSPQPNRHLHRSPFGECRLLRPLKWHEPADRRDRDAVGTSRKTCELEATVDIRLDSPRDIGTVRARIEL
jgi:hypothetical protein